jgi:hypothetical protein
MKNLLIEHVSLLPDVAMKVDLVVSQSKMEASVDSRSKVFAEIKDRYNNLVYTDSSSSVSLEVEDIYKKIITPLSTTENIV